MTARRSDLPVEQKATNADTQEHIFEVRRRLTEFVTALLDRALYHDQSKLDPPEVAIFAEYTPKLAGTTYGSDEYRQYLGEMRVALKHHYAHNDHHPEHHPGGVADMDLRQIVEMLADWKAATERHDDGDMRQSIEHNAERFGIDPQLAQVLMNTAERMGWL